MDDLQWLSSIDRSRDEEWTDWGETRAVVFPAAAVTQICLRVFDLNQSTPSPSTDIINTITATVDQSTNSPVGAHRAEYPPTPPSLPRPTTARRNTTLGIGDVNVGAEGRRAGAGGITDGEDDGDDPQQRSGGGGGGGEGPEEFHHPSRRPAWMRSGVASGVASSLAAAMETNAQFVFKGTMRGGCALLAILSLFLASCQIISLLQEQHEW